MAAQLVEHVIEERDAGGDVAAPPPSRSSRTSTVVSFVVRSTVADLRGVGLGSRDRAGRVGRRRRPGRSRKASSSSGVPTVTRRQPSRRGQRAKLRTSTPRSSRALPQGVGRVGSGRVGARQRSTKLAPDGKTSRSPSGRQPAPRGAPARPRWSPRARPSRRCQRTAQSPASWRGHREVVGQDDLLELVHDPRRRDAEAEPERGQRPHLRVGAHHDQRAVVVDQRIALRARTRRRPRRPRRARAGLEHVPRRTSPSARPCPWGCWAEHRNVTRRAGAGDRARRPRPVVDDEVGAALPSRPPCR